MEKDAYYFPHFSNARTDRKIKRVIKELGVEGYGIYFMILEVLRDQSGFKYPMGDIDLLADEFNTSEQKVRTVVCNYKLFQVDEDENFFSLKFNEFLAPYLEMKEQRRIAGIASGVARRKKAEEQALLNGCSTGVQRLVNENEQKKEEERKEDIYREFKHLSISESDNQKLLELGYTQSQVDSTYDDIENYKNNKNYTSLYLTSRKWLKKNNESIKAVDKTVIAGVYVYPSSKPEGDY